MKQEYYKKDEIKQRFDDFLEDRDEDWIEENIDDIHHYAFNEDYYIIGYYKAEQWLGSVSNVLMSSQQYKNTRTHISENHTQILETLKRWSTCTLIL